MSCLYYHFLFFFTATATTEIYTLSLHDALPIFNTWITPLRLNWPKIPRMPRDWMRFSITWLKSAACWQCCKHRSEEHTSELQSLRHLVCRLLLEKKKKNKKHHTDEQKSHVHNAK